MIDIDFGRVERYVKSGGFGFVSHTLQNRGHLIRRRRSGGRELDNVSFLHISVAKKTLQELVRALDCDDTAAIKTFYFWFEYRSTAKRREVVAALSLPAVRAKYGKQIEAVEVMLRERWADVDTALPDALSKVTENLLSTEEVAELRARRVALSSRRPMNVTLPAGRQYAISVQIPFGIDLGFRCGERATPISQQGTLPGDPGSDVCYDPRYGSARHPAAAAGDEEAEEAEFWRLVADFRSRGFTLSSQVSDYIRENKLGYKYPRIAGNLDLYNPAGDEWTYRGGIKPHWFGKLCHELRVQDKHTDSRVKKFTAHRDIPSSDW